MFCPNCGYPLLDDTVKCEYCGFVIKSKDNKKQTGSEQGSMMNKNAGVGGSVAEGMGTGDNRNRADRRRAANHGGFSAGTSNGKRGGNGGQNIVLKILIGLATFLLVVGIVNIIVTRIFSGNTHGSLAMHTDTTDNQAVIVDGNAAQGKNVNNTETVQESNIQYGDSEKEESKETVTATPTPIPTATLTPTPYPLSSITSHVTDREPSDIGEYKRPPFTWADATSFLVQKAHPEYDNSARSLIDRDYITSWQDGLAGDGSGQQIVIAFDEEHLIHYLEFKLGNWRTLEYYNKNNRPKDMVLTVDGTNFNLDFTDAMIPHYVEFDHPVKAAKLTFTINSVYKGTEANDCCIAEITAFTE